MANPKDCRDRAKCCIEMANDSLDTEVQSSLFEIARAWTELAEELEECAGRRMEPWDSAGAFSGVRWLRPALRKPQ
jgi:hypothetical protein